MVFILPTRSACIRCDFLQALPLSPWSLSLVFYFVFRTHKCALTHTYINQIEKGNGTNLYPSVIRRASIVELHSTCAIVCACVHVKLTTVCLDSVLCPCYSFIKITSGTLWMLGVLPSFFYSAFICKFRCCCFLPRLQYVYLV